jgi:hypothetical protein
MLVVSAVSGAACISHKRGMCCFPGLKLSGSHATRSGEWTVRRFGGLYSRVRVGLGPSRRAAHSRQGRAVACNNLAMHGIRPLPAAHPMSAGREALACACRAFLH